MRENGKNREMNQEKPRESLQLETSILLSSNSRLLNNLTARILSVVLRLHRLLSGNFAFSRLLTDSCDTDERKWLR